MSNRLVIPCLKGNMGSWTTYSCMMRLSDIGELIGFARELHKIERLSDQIQRELVEGRAQEISEYLLDNEDRFFNSIVAAVYDGDPNWHHIGNLRPNNENAKNLQFPEYAEDCLGFLSITKEEKFFALDGQHRLSGIKEALRKNPDIGEELMSVVVVAHSNTPAGKVRSRRLFTTLNKKAKRVSKDSIIAMDEDDVSACITRELIESSCFSFFHEGNVSFNSGPVRNKDSITSIINIYDNVQKLAAFKLGVSVSDLDRCKYKDNEEVYNFVKSVFEETFINCKELYKACKPEFSPGDFRGGESGGHLLFRPIGWDIYTSVVIKGLAYSERSLNELIKDILSKDLYLAGDILGNRVWSRKQKRIMKVSAKQYKAIEKALLHR